MGEKLKSAYELAMERLARKDRESPSASTAPGKLTAAQKAKIAAIRTEYKAKLAEREILYKSERRASEGDPEACEKIDDSYRRDRDHIASTREAKVRAVTEG